MKRGKRRRTYNFLKPTYITPSVGKNTCRKKISWTAYIGFTSLKWGLHWNWHHRQITSEKDKFTGWLPRRQLLFPPSCNSLEYGLWPLLILSVVYYRCLEVHTGYVSQLWLQLHSCIYIMDLIWFNNNDAFPLPGAQPSSAQHDGWSHSPPALCACLARAELSLFAWATVCSWHPPRVSTDRGIVCFGCGMVTGNSYGMVARLEASLSATVLFPGLDHPIPTILFHRASNYQH